MFALELLKIGSCKRLVINTGVGKDDRTSRGQLGILVCNSINQMFFPGFESLKDVMKLGTIAHKVAMSLLEFLQGCLKEVLR